jgi:hypothetical protein
MYKHIRDAHKLQGPKHNYPQWIIDKCQYRVLSSDDSTALIEAYEGLMIELKPFNSANTFDENHPSAQSSKSDLLVLPGRRRIGQKRSSQQIDDDESGSDYELATPSSKRARRRGTARDAQRDSR